MKSFIPIILIGICIAAYYTYISPAYSEIKNLTAKKDSYNEVLQKAKDIIGKRDTIMGNYNSLSPEDMDRLKKLLPDKFDNVLMANHINSIANKHGMTIQDVTLTELQPAVPEDPLLLETQSAQSKYKTHTVSFFVVGRYENFIAFLKDLELNLELVDITNLGITSASKDPKDPNLQYLFELQTYSLN